VRKREKEIERDCQRDEREEERKKRELFKREIHQPQIVHINLHLQFMFLYQKQ